jgi:molybdopterin converting factor small subunit
MYNTGSSNSEYHYYFLASKRGTANKTNKNIKIKIRNKMEQSTTFQIYYFASASSYTKKDTEALPAPLPLSDLFVVLESRYPGIREKVLRSSAVSLGLEYVDVEEAERVNLKSEGNNNKLKEGPVIMIKAGDEVGIIPPVSSG